MSTAIAIEAQGIEGADKLSFLITSGFLLPSCGIGGCSRNLRIRHWLAYQQGRMHRALLGRGGLGGQYLSAIPGAGFVLKGKLWISFPSSMSWVNSTSTSAVPHRSPPPPPYISFTN